jgi:Family of unknown function (DUF6600)
MKRVVIAFAVAAWAVSLPLSTGCAAQEAEAPEASYPQAIGYTPPASAPPAPDLPSTAAAPGSSLEVQPAPRLPFGAPPPNGFASAPGSDGASAVVAPSEPGSAQGGSGQEVAVGEGNDGDTYSDADPSALTDFRATLEPYGTWTEDPTYGTVWAPSPSVVGADFTPYVSAGHWAYDDDYVWVSDYDWGWAPFHYGRWVYNGIGWVWIPGRSYAGAWVSWRYGYGDWGYLGWAPLAPRWCWHGGLAVGIGYAPAMPYAFVSYHDVFAPAVSRRIIAGAQVGVVASHTRPWVAASPHVGGVAGGMQMGGPPPRALNIAAPAVVRSPANNRGLMQAQAFSRPSTAVMLGARAPQTATRQTAMQAGWGAASSWARAPISATAPMATRPSVPSYAPPGQSQSHFGGRLGAGFAGSAPSAAPPIQASPPHAYGESSHPYFGAPPVAAPPYPTQYHSPSVTMAPRYSAPPSLRSPSLGASSSYAAPPAFHAAPSAGGSGAFHGSGPASGGYPAGGGSSHLSGGSFSGGGGFGGGHGGGGGFSGGGHSGGGGRGGHR